MKKLLFALFTILIGMNFSSCSNQTSDSSETDTQTQDEICNLPITSVDDFVLSDGKYDLDCELKDVNSYKDVFIQKKYLLEVKTINSERIEEQKNYYYYYKCSWFNDNKNKDNYEYYKSMYCDPDYDNKGLIFEFDDEAKTIVKKGTEEYYQNNSGESEYIEMINRMIQVFTSREVEGFAKMNKDKTILTMGGNSDIGFITYILKKLD